MAKNPPDHFENVVKFKTCFLFIYFLGKLLHTVQIIWYGTA